MATVVNFVDKVLMNIDDEKIIASVKNEVKDFMKAFPLYPGFNDVENRLIFSS